MTLMTIRMEVVEIVLIIGHEFGGYSEDFDHITKLNNEKHRLIRSQHDAD